MGPAVGRLTGRRTFRALSRPAGRGRSGPIRAVFVPLVEGPSTPRVGYAIGRRHGGAVQRNRLRRRLREAVRTAVRAAPERFPGGAYLVSAEPPAAVLAHRELERRTADALASAASTNNVPRGATGRGESEGSPVRD